MFRQFFKIDGGIITKNTKVGDKKWTIKYFRRNKKRNENKSNYRWLLAEQIKMPKEKLKRKLDGIDVIEVDELEIFFLI